ARGPRGLPGSERGPRAVRRWGLQGRGRGVAQPAHGPRLIPETAMSTGTVGLLLAGVALALAWPVPVLLARARWPMHAPVRALLLWQAIGLAGGVSMIGALALLGHAAAPGHPVAAVVPAILLACYLLAHLGVTVVQVSRQRRRHLTLLRLLTAPHPTRARTRVIDEAVPVAYCIPRGAGGRDRPRTRTRRAAARHPAAGVPRLAVRPPGPADRSPRRDGGRRAGGDAGRRPCPPRDPRRGGGPRDPPGRRGRRRRPRSRRQRQERGGGHLRQRAHGRPTPPPRGAGPGAPAVSPGRPRPGQPRWTTRSPGRRSAWRCETRITTRSSAAARMSPIMASAVGASRCAVGSSSRRTSARVSRARATASR